MDKGNKLDFRGQHIYVGMTEGIITLPQSLPSREGRKMLAEFCCN
ncbi:MAG: hypothetical protein STSR0002_24160 [Smithella sp.]